MKPRVKTTHRHHRALPLLMLGSAAIISSLRGCLSMAKIHTSQSDFNDSILYHQFAVSHDITKEWIQPCTTGWEAMFCWKISNRSSRFSSSSPLHPDILFMIGSVQKNITRIKIRSDKHGHQRWISYIQYMIYIYSIFIYIYIYSM